MRRLAIYFIVALSIAGCSVASHNTVSKPASADSVLAFPVSGKKATIGSFWGDGREEGKRKHEGIDIFAKKGTKVVAVCNGIIGSVGNGGIGGKTIWLQADNYSWSAYYAHLDSQFVYAGQQVERGDVLGTVGNTGNAKYTPPHLHFGIYTWAGAVDPLPFVKTAPKILIDSQEEEKITKPAKLPAKRKVLKKAVPPKTKKA